MTVNRPPSLLLFNALPEVETAFGVVRPNGQGKNQVLSHDYSAQAWSPSGRRILAYGRADRPGDPRRPGPCRAEHSRWAAGSRGGVVAERAVGRGLLERCPHPDFCADLRILRTDSDKERTLVSEGVLDLGAGAIFDWAPDSRSLAYSGSPSPGQGPRGYKGIVVVSLDGSTVAPEPFRNGTDPSWAPQGGRLAFSRGGQIYSALRDGSGLRRLTRGLHSFGPSWSPHGRRVAYFRASGDRFRIEVVDVRSERVTYVGSADSKVPLVWSPGGSRLTWSDGYRGTDYVFVARADGRGRPRPVTVGVDPDWR